LSVFEIDSHHIYRVAPLARLSWLEHGFGTRHTRAWPARERLVALHQIHSDRILTADGTARGRIGEGDGLITNRAGILLGVRTADCPPILIVDERRRAVSAIHAGWRGAVAGIAARAVERLASEFGSRPEDLLAAIGPSIGGCCYQVGPEVASQFRGIFPERGDLDRKSRIDLSEAIRRQLVTAGIPRERIFAGAPCTLCDPDFHSFRRDRTEERMYSVIGIREAV